ncbi:hypothetical protein CVT24_008580 [Panaeolus cyanescens]|uniref:F-box domain-containing protein n=1 Tax=Panaeolus cyanescens TaxID=181874 RepID=A0A409VKT4_9AGAR|nr:hypothetical protein CVT24_008580 [Panaeolus cyanescens]
MADPVFPIEIFTLILDSIFDTDDDRSAIETITLHNLMLVSMAFADICRRYRYKVVDLHWDRRNGETDISYIQSFIQIVRGVPSIQRHVEELGLSAHEDSARLAVMSSEISTQLAETISLFTNLRTLKLVGLDVSRRTRGLSTSKDNTDTLQWLAGKLLQHHLVSQTTPKLRELNIMGSSSCFRDHWAAIISSQKLTTLNLSGSLYQSFYLYSHSMEPQSLHITELRISSYTYFHLHHLLQFPKLKVLSLTQSSLEPMPFTSPSDPNWANAMSSAHSKKTMHPSFSLTSLELLGHYGAGAVSKFWKFYDNHARAARHGPFDVLTTFHCDAVEPECIAAIGSLLKTTPALEELTLDADTSFLLSSLQLPERLRDTFPMLSRMWFNIPTYDTPKEVLDDILQSFKNIPRSNVLQSIGLVIELNIINDSATCLDSARNFWTALASLLASLEEFPRLRDISPAVFLVQRRDSDDRDTYSAPEKTVITTHFNDMFETSFAALTEARPSVKVDWQIRFD